LPLLALAGPIPAAAPREERDITIQRMRPENAACLIKRRSPYVRAWLQTLAGTKAERQAIRPVEQDFTACFTYFPNAYRSTWDYPGIRRGLVRELLRSRIAHLPVAPPSGLNRSAWFAPDQARDPAARPSIIANDLGFCLARSDWTIVREAAATQLDTPDASAALKSLVPKVAGCLPPGQRLTLDVARLHAILVETVYHATTD
jgi:hypothetical protein